MYIVDLGLKMPHFSPGGGQLAKGYKCWVAWDVTQKGEQGLLGPILL